MTTQFSFKDLTAKIPSFTHLIHCLAGWLPNSLSHSIRTSIICQQNAIADNRLRSPLHHFSSDIPKSVASFSAKRPLSRVHLQKVHSKVGCIYLMLPPVCLSPRYVKASLIWSISSIGMKLGMFLVYTEPSTMRIGDAGFDQLANVVSFCDPDFVPLTQFSLEKCIFLPHGDVVQNVTYGKKIEISMLYFPPNSLLTRHRINVLKKAKHRLLTCRNPGTRRVLLHLISEVRNSVASRMQRVNTALFKTNFNFMFFLKLDNMKWALPTKHAKHFEKMAELTYAELTQGRESTRLSHTHKVTSLKNVVTSALHKLINEYIFKPKFNCRRKCMQEKESIMVVWCKLRVPSLRITVRHHSASLAMLNSYRRDRSFNPQLTGIQNSYT